MKNFLVSLPKPSNIVAREPISSIEGHADWRHQSGSIDSLRISVTLRGSLVGFVHPQRADARPRLELPF